MRVLLTGIEGYIGSVLSSYLVKTGFEVFGLDTGLYREGWLYTSHDKTAYFPPVLNKDLRHLTPNDLEDFDAIVHLAELSNDPLCENNKDLTYNINHKGSVNLASLAKQAGVKRFIYMSSCSVYGFNTKEILTEESAPDPQTVYATCKVLVEKDLKHLADESFSPVFLRNATAYGISPRMRFDIVLNNLAGLAQTTKKIAMTSDGTPWRPLVHVLDISQAIKCCLLAPVKTIHNQTFNVGHNEDNYQVKDIAGIVAKVFSDCELTFGPGDGDERSYRISFDKITKSLPGFKCQWDALKGAQELCDLFKRIELDKETFEFRAFTRLKQLRFLQKTNQIDAEFFWRY